MKFAIVRTVVSTALFCFALTVVPANVDAQIATHLGVGISAGIPVGQQSDGVRTGVGGMVFAALGSNTSPLGVRIDVSSHQLRGRKVAGNKLDNGNFTSATFNAVATATVFRYIKPYAIGGIGWYSIKQGSERKDKAGVNTGAGITFPALGRAAFLEARYHRVYSGGPGYRLIPVTIGILF